MLVENTNNHLVDSGGTSQTRNEYRVIPSLFRCQRLVVGGGGGGREFLTRPILCSYEI